MASMGPICGHLIEANVLAMEAKDLTLPTCSRKIVKHKVAFSNGPFESSESSMDLQSKL